MLNIAPPVSSRVLLEAPLYKREISIEFASVRTYDYSTYIVRCVWVDGSAYSTKCIVPVAVLVYREDDQITNIVR